MTLHSTSGVIFSSPELPSTPLNTTTSPSPTTTLSSFPLPYRSQSATYYRTPSSEYPSTTLPLTSQDLRTYQSSPTPGLPGSFSSPDDSRPSASVTGLSNSYRLVSSPNIGPFSSPNWQNRDLKWPQSRSQSSRKYVPKGRGYDSHINQRRVAPRNGILHPAKKYSLSGPNQTTDRRVSNTRKKKIDESVTRRNNATSPTEMPRLVDHALPASLDDSEADKTSSITKTPTSVSRYVSPKDEEDSSVQSIRNSQYWTQLKHDPIFSDLSTRSETISITDLKQRRDQILQNHAPPPPPRQVIMKEQGTQTDPEESLPFPRPKTTTPTNQARDLSNQEQYKPGFRPKSVPHSRKISHAKERNQHARTSSLTDTDSPRIHTQQLNGGRSGFKRSRSAAEEDLEEGDYPHRRKVGGGVGQGAFYRYHPS